MMYALAVRLVLRGKQDLLDDVLDLLHGGDLPGQRLVGEIEDPEGQPLGRLLVELLGCFPCPL